MRIVCLYKYVVPVLFTLVFCLSIHVGLTQLGVPFPDEALALKENFAFVLTSSIGFMALSYFAVVYFGDKKSFFVKISIVFVLMMMLSGSLLRGPFMDGLVSNNFSVAFLLALPVYLKGFVLSIVMVIGYEVCARKPGRMIAGIVFVIMAAILVSVRLAYNSLSPPLLEWITGFSVQSELEDGNAQGYGMYVLISAYLTFIFPTVTVFLYYRAFREGIKLHSIQTVILFSVIILLAMGYFAVAILSGSIPFLQFVVEYAALALLAGFFVERLSK